MIKLIPFEDLNLKSLKSLFSPCDFFFFIYTRSDEANKAFSAAVQMHDTLVKAWALWGDYLEQIYCKER